MSNQTRLAPGPSPSTGFLRQAQLIPGILPFSSATLWRMVKTGEFPAPIKLSARVTAWRTEEVREWMDTRQEGTPGEGADAQTSKQTTNSRKGSIPEGGSPISASKNQEVR